MATTVLFVEHLITGLQAAVWIGLIIFSCFGFDWVKLDVVKDFESVAIVLLLSFVYPIGLFVDNFADAILKNWSERIRDQRMKKENLEGGSLLIMKVLKDIDDDYLKAYIGYVRTRMRISRSTAVNFALITITSLIFTSTRLTTLPQSQFILLLAFEVIAGLAITTLALLSWRSITNTFARQIVRASKAFDKGEKPKEKKTV
jgi:hypothetical protein